MSLTIQQSSEFSPANVQFSKLRKNKNGHDFRSSSYVKSILAYVTICRTSKANDNISE